MEQISKRISNKNIKETKSHERKGAQIFILTKLRKASKENLKIQY